MDPAELWLGLGAEGLIGDYRVVNVRQGKGRDLEIFIPNRSAGNRPP